MKKILFTAGLLVALWMPPFSAQSQEFNRANFEQTIARLNLNDAQKSAAEPIIEQGLRERLSILKAAGFQKGKKPTFRQLLTVKDPIRASQAKTRSQLSQILSSVQMVEYDRILDEGRQKMRTRLR